MLCITILKYGKNNRLTISMWKKYANSEVNSSELIKTKYVLLCKKWSIFRNFEAL